MKGDPYDAAGAWASFKASHDAYMNKRRNRKRLADKIRRHRRRIALVERFCRGHVKEGNALLDEVIRLRDLVRPENQHVYRHA